MVLIQPWHQGVFSLEDNLLWGMILPYPQTSSYVAFHKDSECGLGSEVMFSIKESFVQITVELFIFNLKT